VVVSPPIWPDSAPLGERVDQGGDYSHGVAPYALDPVNAARLWDESLRLLK
jgi:hypothetical protein